MIVYLFSDNDFMTLNLPMIISGIYSLKINDIFVANLVSSDNNDYWQVELNNKYMSNSLNSSNYALKIYEFHTINSSYGNEVYYLVAVPKYDGTRLLYNTLDAEIVIGDNQTCDIYYNYGEGITNGNNIITLKRDTDAKWSVKTDSKMFFTSKRRLVDEDRLLNGDFIFFNGLKVILAGTIIICNNPNGQVIVLENRLTKKEEAQAFSVPLNYATDDEVKPRYTKKDYFYKSPRLNYIVKHAVVKIDEPPAREQESELPVILTVGPQLTMVATSCFTLVNTISSYVSGSTSNLRFLTALGTTVVMVGGALLWPAITRRFNKNRLAKKEKKRIERYSAYLEKKKEEIEAVKKDQKDTILLNHPSSNQCLKIIEYQSSALWQRNIDHDDFLKIRLGVGTVKTDIEIAVPEEKFELDDEDKLLTNLKEITHDALTISEVPISYSFPKMPINAIVGNEENLKSLLDNLFLQIMTFHSYNDLKLVVYSKTNKWDYLKNIPHCWNNQRTMRYFATTVEELSVISTELEKIFDLRVSDSEEEKLEDDGEDYASESYKNYRPYYLFFIDDLSSIRNISLINKILKYKKNMGFSLIITSESISTLPGETKDFICVNQDVSTIFSSEHSNNQVEFQADLLKYDELVLYDYTKRLANIPIPVEKERFDLPKSLSFLELYNVGRVEQLNSLARWTENNPVISLNVPIGIDQNGEIFKMDIHEKAYGPHGLVAGTTGSGKSEWIVTYILSLAVNFSPEEVQFVLIDYKGGGLAMSFENASLNVKLPHLAGTITNLDKSEINRSIAAIESELKRRQTIFNEAREKLKEGSMNIYKYQQYYRKGLVDEPLSHLLIICDEFAELKSQQPEFMDQLISTSRIGRSLGIHLILATQKPSGVVNDQIWSNSKFKVCLKVQDKGDSNEILKKPDAAFLKQTGAFYLQVGNDDYYNLGQSAWAGAKYYPSDVIKKNIDESIEHIDNIGRVINSYGDNDTVDTRKSEGEELLNVVTYISDISKTVPNKSKSLWLENIDSHILLNDLMKKYNYQLGKKDNYDVIVGEYDEPRKQLQGLLKLNLEDGNIAIIGGIGAGKESLISTIIWQSITEHTPYELAYYIIDFGAETMKKFSKFPHVGEVVFQDDMDSVAGVLDLIMEEMNKRKDLLSDYNGSFTYYNSISGVKKLPLIVTIINGFDVFNETLPRLNEVMTNLFRDAVKYGMIFIVSVSSTSAIRQRQLQYFNHTIVMNLADDSQYRTITNCRRGLIPKKCFGRGICKTEASETDSYCEFQTARISSDDTELTVIRDYANKCVDYYNYKVKQLVKIPDDIKSNDLIKYIGGLNDLPIGYSFYEKNISKYDLLKEKIHIITGKSIKDKIEFIYGLVNIVSKVPNVKVRVVDMIDIFKKPILDIKLFNEDLNVVFGALENDVLTRTDNQDYGINFILGVGSYKKILTKGGIEIFRNLFSKLPDSKKNIYVLIDDYDKIRNLKLESWFDQVNLDNGIWLGNGVGSQSLLNVSEVSAEDSKYNYVGLGFVVNNKEYTVIKTVMDKDE